MHQQNLNNFFENGKLPVGIPSPDFAWQQMQIRLDKEMKEKRKNRMIIFFMLIVFICPGAILFKLNNYNNGGTASIPAQKIKTAESGNQHYEQDTNPIMALREGGKKASGITSGDIKEKVDDNSLKG